MATANTLIHSLRIILMSSGALFIAILLSLSLNPLLSSAASELPSFWSSLSAWLRPPYLYFIINGIIITIAASSRLHHHSPPPEFAPHQPPKMSPPPQYRIRAEQFSPYDAVSVAKVVSGDDSYYAAVSVKEVDVEVLKSTGIEERQSRIVEEVKTPEVEFEISAAEIDHESEESAVADEMSTWTPPPSSPLERQHPVEDSPEFFLERPAASSSFGPPRRAAKASPAEGGFSNHVLLLPASVTFFYLLLLLQPPSTSSTACSGSRDAISTSCCCSERLRPRTIPEFDFHPILMCNRVTN